MILRRYRPERSPCPTYALTGHPSPLHRHLDIDVNIEPPRKIGILGGAFNPPHLGHLLLAQTALEQFHLHQILWIPTYCAPHKSSGLLHFEHRWEMVCRAIANNTDFYISDIEQQNQGISYADTTLQSLKAHAPNTHWYWLLGLDAFQTLPRWRHSTEVATQCIWLIAPRNSSTHHHDYAACQQVATQLTSHVEAVEWHLLEMPQIGISSSLIRQYRQSGRSLRYLVPEPVRQYINQHNLYLDSQPNATH